MLTHRLAIVAFGLIAAMALMGCSSSQTYWNDQAQATAQASPTVPGAQPAPYDPNAQAAPGTAGQRPPNARPGEVWCYVRVPAVTRTISEQVCVQPETSRQEWVPPVKKMVEEQVCVQPEQIRKIPIPAVYEEQSEQVLVCPAKTEWRRVNCEPKSLSEGEQLGECWSLVEIPAQYETRTKTVCVQQESCREEVIPAQYEARTKEVVVTPGYYKNIPVPAQYETRCREELVSPARWEWRRTSECEVPCDTGQGAPAAAPGYAPDLMGGSPDAGSPDAGSPDAGSPDASLPPAGSPDDLPPAGDLPPADPFAPTR